MHKPHDRRNPHHAHKRRIQGLRRRSGGKPFSPRGNHKGTPTQRHLRLEGIQPGLQSQPPDSAGETRQAHRSRIRLTGSCAIAFKVATLNQATPPKARRGTTTWFTARATRASRRTAANRRPLSPRAPPITAPCC
ncbi:hypothetical protein MAIT1_04504 [Magnetofaba australis IT-1]|uniref:Uncharacterized protein n=1 Tax=Magnetofaba australis IT-1 TaxID=1434232 RepID=A0A1Y2K964_9PROT|nr:hypothetical protein MAIT1_04504 [Magnetofaba australis IT-1]